MPWFVWTAGDELEAAVGDQVDPTPETSVALVTGLSVGMAAVVLVVVVLLGWWWWRRRKRRPAPGGEGGALSE